jgi:hypothetical protein
MGAGIEKPSSRIRVVIASCVESQSGSPVTRELKHNKTKDETRVDELKARATSVPLHPTLV